MKPQQWGEKVTGVLTKLPTQEKQVALTLDACGGPHGSGYDQELIDYLRQEKIPATLFVNSRWIKANESLFLELARDPLFEIANHGTEHRPLSVNGRSIYGISGTTDPKHIIDEVWENHLLITRLTGKEPRFFRSGTAYYDEIAVQLVEQMGEKVTHFDVIGDAGATFSADQVHHAMKRVKSGSIVILHMNQPQSGTAEGLKKAIPELKKKGFQFVKLEDSVTSNS
ncbi:polysaccharide deacetylase family protein [Risungbinella massiliensis]|uniref:polysaccharide deacetylase family protein n=1 Tax=Risungbinella massiliensis TaxID=1329796 RepID=UPI001E317D1A|nr:polysaccharide deacetylase family protein [Risungbinella massiliensis]